MNSHQDIGLWCNLVKTWTLTCLVTMFVDSFANLFFLTSYFPWCYVIFVCMNFPHNLTLRSLLQPAFFAHLLAGKRETVTASLFATRSGRRWTFHHSLWFSSPDLESTLCPVWTPTLNCSIKYVLTLGDIAMTFLCTFSAQPLWICLSSSLSGWSSSLSL